VLASALVGDPELNGGWGSYSIASWSDSASSRPWDVIGQRQCHVDSSRDTGAADMVALPYHPVGDDLDSHRPQVVTGFRFRAPR
jgi:hypothetical protein